MDKQARLGAIMNSISEYIETIEQARYGVELGLKSREYAHIKLCADKALRAGLLIEDLSIEARSLQESIEDDAKEDLL